jgi:hypothetical protein
MLRCDVKAGDKVIVHDLWNGDRIEVVEAATKTQFTAAGRKWLKRLGRPMGSDSWTRVWAEPATEQAIQHMVAAKREAEQRERFATLSKRLSCLRVTASNVGAVETFLSQVEPK